ncbi:SPOR domain-containing protein [Photobacterium piscicola]|uniref:SPOR domain-containing protein n=1 Tax=Photobacterium piscicola TaxID=1378299 RepID=A0ABU6LG21_9GAMM|nr:SPOR domain-containing protein [Photobacterium piscicola]
MKKIITLSLLSSLVGCAQLMPPKTSLQTPIETINTTQSTEKFVEPTVVAELDKSVKTDPLYQSIDSIAVSEQVIKEQPAVKVTPTTENTSEPTAIKETNELAVDTPTNIDAAAVEPAENTTTDIDAAVAEPAEKTATDIDAAVVEPAENTTTNIDAAAAEPAENTATDAAVAEPAENTATNIDAAAAEPAENTATDVDAAVAEPAENTATNIDAAAAEPAENTATDVDAGATESAINAVTEMDAASIESAVNAATETDNTAASVTDEPEPVESSNDTTVDDQTAVDEQVPANEPITDDEYKTTVMHGYSVQVTASRDEQSLVTLLSLLDSQQPAWLNKKMINGSQVYTLLLGHYSDHEQAKAALALLPDAVQNNGAFVRNFYEIEHTRSPQLKQLQ